MSDDIDLTDDEYDTFIVDLAEQRCQHSHADTACPPPPERAILLDLIADLRAHHQGEPASGLLNGDGKIRCQTCVYQVCPCATAMHLDRAEARLREVTGDE